MFWRSKAIISLSSISIPTKRQWLEDSSLRKFLCLGILINQKKPFGLLPTAVRLTNPSPHSSLYRQRCFHRGLAATREEAEAYVAGLSSGRNTRVVESSDPANYRWADGRIVRP